jgi:toxin-antitoxin system PIN domain toxin
VIAVDTNILVYAHRPDSPHCAAAAAELAWLVGSPGPWAVAWPCAHEFLAVVTSTRVFPVPTPLPRALEQVVAWRESGAVFLAEATGYWDRLAGLVLAGGVTGPKIHDARIAALCLDHGIDELWTSDRDFSRFPALKVRNPLVNPRARRSADRPDARLP